MEFSAQEQKNMRKFIRIHATNSFVRLAVMYHGNKRTETSRRESFMTDLANYLHVDRSAIQMWIRNGFPGNVICKVLEFKEENQYPFTFYKHQFFPPNEIITSNLDHFCNLVKVNPTAVDLFDGWDSNRKFNGRDIR